MCTRVKMWLYGSTLPIIMLSTFLVPSMGRCRPKALVQKSLSLRFTPCARIRGAPGTLTSDTTASVWYFSALSGLSAGTLELSVQMCASVTRTRSICWRTLVPFGSAVL